MDWYLPQRRQTRRVPEAVAIAILTLVAFTTSSIATVAEQRSLTNDKQGGASARSVPDEYKLNLMIRTTLIALNQANQTGNYSVLRDLAAPQFQLVNSNVQLADIFADIRRRNLDLSPIIFFTPKLIRPPTIQQDGILRMTGYFETKPDRVSFDMGFAQIDGQWRLAALIVEVKPPAKPAPAGGATRGGEDAPKNSKGAPRVDDSAK
jgi:hypothetical protein